MTKNPGRQDHDQA